MVRQPANSTASREMETNRLYRNTSFIRKQI
jgi:hypothetical protein